MEGEMLKFGANIDAKSIYDLLETKPIDTVVTYDEIKTICLKREDEFLRSSISRAIKMLRNNGIIYHNVRLIGYKRANSSDIVKKNPSFLASARKRLTTGKKELEAVDDEVLTNEEKVKKNTCFAVTGLMLHLAKPKQTKALEQKVMNHTLSFNPIDNLKYLANS